MSTITVAEMTPESLQSLIFKTVHKAIDDAMGGDAWRIEWQKLIKHQHYLTSLYAEFADTDLALAEAGIADYADLLSQEDSAR